MSSIPLKCVVRRRCVTKRRRLAEKRYGESTRSGIHPTGKLTPTLPHLIGWRLELGNLSCCQAPVLVIRRDQQKVGAGPPRHYPASKSGTVMDRGMVGNRRLSRFAECTMLNTGTLLRDVNGSGDYLRGQLRRESPEALRWRQYRKGEAPRPVRGTKRQVGNKTI